MDTEAKILAFLSVRPQTSEELWKNSRIHKNTMVKRLTALVEGNCVIKHRYTLLNNERNYGRLFKLNYEPVAKIGRIYYLLNYSSNATKNHLSFYFRKHRPYEKLEDKLIERILTTIPLPELANKTFNWIDNLSTSDLQKVISDATKYDVNIHKKRLGIDFELVRNGINFTRRYEYGLKGFRSVIDYFSKSSGSIFDVIIRVMTDPILKTEVKVLKEMLGYRYIDLWNILEKENLLPRERKLDI